MNVIWIIAKREFTSNIFSLRLLIGLIVCLVLFVSSTYVLIEDYAGRLRVFNADEAKHRNKLENVKVYSELSMNVDKSPEPLSVICLGMEKQLENTVRGFLHKPTKRCTKRYARVDNHTFSPVNIGVSLFLR